MLHDFIVMNREQIIARARQRVSQRTAPTASEAKLEHGIPLFLTQLAAALAPAAHEGTSSPDGPEGACQNVASQKITGSAALHGHDLLRTGFTIAQVVHGYGDVCQIVTDLASETNAAISAKDFRVFNRCLDDAIAGAVTEYGRQREQDLAHEGTERLGVLAHELRNLLNNAMLSFEVLKRGLIGLGGSKVAMHARNLSQLRTLVERSLAGVRLEANILRFERVSVPEFIEDMALSASLHADGYGLHLSVESVDGDVEIEADRQLLASAVSNLLQNAFKFSRAHGKVSLTARATADRVMIEVSDECGGLPEGKAEGLFHPFIRGHSDLSGLGLGLSIALSAVRANFGTLNVCDLPGKGCIFTIELPRRPGPGMSILPVLPDSGDS